MRKVFLALLVLFLFMLACGSSGSTIKTVNDYVEEFGGNPDVYNRILSMNDCASLQGEFDQAFENSEIQEPGTDQHQWSVGYMTAADDRMKALGCYIQTDSAPTVDLSVMIAQTSNAALAFTQAAYSPTVNVTSTNLPTLTQLVIPTPITISTSANVPRPTNTFIFILPTQPTSSGATCSCSGDQYNCEEHFSTQARAQACFNYCVSQGRGDIHRLDGNNDGEACESLP